MDFQRVARFSYLISHRLTDTLLEVESRELEQWLAESKANRELMRKFYRQDFLSRKQIEEQLFDCSQAFRKVRTRKQRQIVRRHWVRICGTVAAAVVLLVGVTILLRYKSQEQELPMAIVNTIPSGTSQAVLILAGGQRMELSDKMPDTIVYKDGMKVCATGKQIEYEKNNVISEEPDLYNTLEVPRKGEFLLVLEEGTKVWLNSETKLRYPVRFSRHERRVFLEGEAYFEVAKNEEKPFIVSSGKSEVKVLGTSFNMRAYKDEDCVYATLTEGSINLSAGKQMVLLKPDEQGIVDTYGNITKQPVEVQLYTGWREGRFIFWEQRLEEIMNTLSRWYDIQVFFSSKEVREIIFTGNLKRHDSFDKIIEMLEMTDVAHFKVNNNTIIISK